jgi:hypothetical protein
MKRVMDVTMAREQPGTLLGKVFQKKDIVVTQGKGKSLAKMTPLENSDNPDTPHPYISSQQQALPNETPGGHIHKR